MKSVKIISGDPWLFKKIPNKEMWRLYNDVMYEIDYGTHKLFIKVPFGFEYDLASVPPMFQWMFGKKEEVGIHAALLHDYAYKTHCLTRKEADKAFLKLMEYYQNPKSGWKRFLMYQAVNLFGGNPYKHKK